MSFVHLHTHSYYSLMWGVRSPETLCRAAANMGMTHLALTDTNGLYGLVPFLKAAHRHGIRPVVGAFLRHGRESAVILTKTPKGYELLCELLTRKHLQPDFSLKAHFPENRGDLALLASDAELLKALRNKTECWVEVLPAAEGNGALRLARELNLPPVAANAAHFLTPEDHELHRLLRAIDCNRTLSTLPRDQMVSARCWLKPPDRMERHFPHCPEALRNSFKLARQCRSEWEMDKTVFPYYQALQKDHFSLLLQCCRDGIRWRYRHSNAAIERRLAEELSLIRDKGYVDYFLVVAEIVRLRPIQCGRGSAAASLVSYLLGITHVDPIEHHLVFGRFLNPQRRDHPDIDVDFPWDERDELLDEVEKMYGHERFAMVANQVGFGGRAAVREVAKVYGIPADRIKQVTRRLSGWTRPGNIRKRVKEHPKFKQFPLDPPWPEILDLASKLEGIPRHLSVHCGGIILTPGAVSRHVPVERSAKGVRVIQWEKDQTEASGLVKIDLLGNRSLAVIRDALKAVEANTGRRIEYASFNPLHDPATLKLLEQGRTMGVFYVESPAMRQLQQMTKRGDFEHLVIHSSIIRPAANRYIQEYIRRLHGAPYQPIHPSLEQLLAESYGILVYQEQVVQAAMILAGFDWAEADGLRKVLSKKNREQIADYRRRFTGGCARRGVSADVIESVWDMFTSFAGYSFCKPHSASYALVSFKSAYLKAHYPAEFMAAVISNGGGYYTPFAYLSEARRMGLTVLGPDINRSAWAYTGRGREIRMGLQQLIGIREDTVKTLLHERERNGPFQSLEDLVERVVLPPMDGTVLVKSGALDSLAGSFNRPQLLWWMTARLRAQKSATEGGRRMAFGIGGGAVRVPSLPDLSAESKWLQEEETLGFMLSAHPLARYRRGDTRGGRVAGIVAAVDLHRYVGKLVEVLGWPITSKEVLTRDGEAMQFVTFEDRTDIYETVFFPEAFRKFCQHFDKGRGYLLKALVQQEFGVESLLVKELRPLAPTGDPAFDWS